MKKATTVILLLFALCWQANAQSRKEKNVQVKRYKWDVGTDLLWLIDKNSVPPSVFVRLNTDKNGRLSAYRFRLGGDYAEHLNTVDSVSSTQTKTLINTFVSVGKEWQKQYDQFQLFYGSDIFFNYTLSVAEHARDEEGYFPRQRDRTLGVSSLIGMRYFVNSRVSVSTEGHLNVYFHEFYRKAFSQNQSDQDGRNLRVTENRIHYLKMNINPFYTLNFTYHF